MRQAVLASLARAMNNSPDPVFGNANHNLGELASFQTAYWKFKDNDYDKILPTLIRPYRKSTGKPVFSYRESKAALVDYEHNPALFKKRYRLIAKMQGADKYIAKALNFYLSRMLEGQFCHRGGAVPYLSNRCYSYRKTRGVHDALTYLEKCTYSEGFNVVARTDIKSYFDVINREKLVTQLRKLFKDRKSADSESIISWLTSLAGAEKKLEWKVCKGSRGNGANGSIFTSDTVIDNSLGIPQGNPISAPLSNLYLSDIDYEMINAEGEDYRYLRYADDIMICAKSEEIAQNALNSLRDSLKKLNLELGEDKTSIDDISSGNVCFLGFHYLKDKQGKEIAADKLKKFKDKIKHLTSRQHVDDNAGDISKIIHDINLRILVTRGQTKVDADQPAKLSSHSFCVHYNHNSEDAVFKQMGSLDAYIRWRIARILTDPAVRNCDCHREFFRNILPKHNMKLRSNGGKPINLIPLTGVFKNLKSIRSAGSYGLDL
jgi:hypothetical protein